MNVDKKAEIKLFLEKTKLVLEKTDKVLILLIIYLIIFGAIFDFFRRFKHGQVNTWLNGKSYYLTTPLNREIAEKAIKINSLYQDEILNKINDLNIKLIEYSSLDAPTFLKNIERNLSNIVNNNDYFTVDDKICSEVNIAGEKPNGESYNKMKNCSSLRAIFLINSSIKSIQINSDIFQEINQYLNYFEEEIKIIQKDDKKTEISQEISKIKTYIEEFEQKTNQDLNSSILKLSTLLDNLYVKNSISQYEYFLINSLCQSRSYKSFCLHKGQEEQSQSNSGESGEKQDNSNTRTQEWKEEFEKELEYIVILSNLEASPAQKERITQQLNLIEQQMEIAKNKLIFYNSLDFTTGLLAWPLALISGIVFVFLTKDGLKKVFNSQLIGAKIPGTLFIVNSFCLILVTQIPLLLQLNQSYKYHLKTLIECVNTEHKILSYIATNGASEKNKLINKNPEYEKLSKIAKNSIFIKIIDQALYDLISRFDPGINPGALPDTSKYFQYFDTTSQNTQPETQENQTGNNSKLPFDFGND